VTDAILAAAGTPTRASAPRQWAVCRARPAAPQEAITTEGRGSAGYFFPFRAAATPEGPQCDVEACADVCERAAVCMLRPQLAAEIPSRSIWCCRYEIACVGPQGEIKWRDTIDNPVTAGKNLALDSFLAGAEAAVDGGAGTLLSADVFSAATSVYTMMPESHQLVRQPGNDALGASVELGRNSFGQRSYLRDAYARIRLDFAS
jgi:hypothetical protein